MAHFRYFWGISCVLMYSPVSSNMACWKIDHWNNWFSHWNLHLHGISHCHVWLPEGIYSCHVMTRCESLILDCPTSLAQRPLYNGFCRKKQPLGWFRSQLNFDRVVLVVQNMSCFVFSSHVCQWTHDTHRCRDWDLPNFDEYHFYHLSLLQSLFYF